MATIRRRPERGSTWQATYRTPDGREHAKLFERKTDAEAWVAKEQADRARGVYVDPDAGRQKFEDFVDEWAGSQDWKASTREGWPMIRARLLSLLGRMPLATIDLLALQRAQTRLKARYARATVETTMAYAGMIMRAAYASGRIGRDPTRGLRAPKARADEPDGKVGPDQVPTRSEALAILEAAPSRYRAAIALGLAGLRVGEVLGLTADRLVVERREVTIDRQLQRLGGHLMLTTPKAENPRTIVVPGIVAVELRRHLRDHRGKGLLFRGPRSSAPRSCDNGDGDQCGIGMRRDQFYDSAWRPALAGADLATDRFVFHALRHFCASSLLAEGAPLAAVAGHLGDTVDTVSRTYVHWLRDDRDVPADVLDRVLAPANADQTRTNGVSLG